MTYTAQADKRQLDRTLEPRIGDDARLRPTTRRGIRTVHGIRPGRDPDHLVVVVLRGLAAIAFGSSR